MSFLSWYFQAGILQVAKICLSCVILVFEFFSIPELARTLIFPWRRDVIKPVNPTLQQIFEALALNLVSRFFGLIIRSLTLLAGLSATLATLILALLILTLMAFLPLSLPLLLIGSLFLIVSPGLIIPGLLLLALALTLIYLVYLLYRFYLDHPPAPSSGPQTISQALAQLHQGEKINLSPFLTPSARQIFLSSQNLSELRQTLLKSPKARFIFSRAGLNPALLPADHQPKIAPFEFLMKAGESAFEEQHRQIEVGDLIIALAQFDPSLGQALKQAELNLADLKQIVFWQTKLWQRINPPSPLIDPKNIKTTGGVAKDWASGYTPTLDQYSADLTDQVNHPSIDSLYQAHRASIEQIETILARSGRHNVILLGPAGIGKRQTVLGFSRQVLMGKTRRPLIHKRVKELNLNSLLAGLNRPGDLETRLVTILNEAVSAGNIILFIDHIERLLDTQEGAIGAINASQILLPYLSSPLLQLIASSSFPSYHRFIQNQPGLEQALEKIEIPEPDASQTLRILEEVAIGLEAQHQLLISYLALKEVIKASDRLFPSRPFPQKAIDTLDEIASFSASHNLSFISPDIVNQYLSKKTHIPLGKTTLSQKDLLINLETVLHQDIVNQNQAVRQVAEALRRSAAGVAEENQPLGSFLFLGPTGVGKTALAKSLAQHFFGSAQQMIRFDMSEYQEIQDIKRLIGDEKSQTPGLLTSQIQERPYSLLLFDEVEKAHHNILNLFLQLLDEGQITDSLGQKVYFKNCLVIATSNAGANFIRQSLKQGTTMEQIQGQLLDYIQNQGIFSPELVNRFDGMIAFRSLTVAELTQVVDIMVRRLNQRLREKELKIILTPLAKAKLAQIGQSPEYGARALERTVQDKLENYLADLILKDRVSRGQTLVISDKMIQ